MGTPVDNSQISTIVVGPPVGPPPGVPVHNGMLFLLVAMMSLNNKQMTLTENESDSAKIFGNADIKLSNAVMASLQKISDSMNAIVNNKNTDFSDPEVSDELQADSTEFSTVQQAGQMGMSTLQSQMQGFNTLLQLSMQAMQAMMQIYDAISSKAAFDASLTAS